MRHLFPVLLIAACLLPAAARAQTTVTAAADLRVRQEDMRGMLYFAPDPDRNQVRFRTRAGFSVDDGTETFQLLLANEHRRHVHPDGVDFDWDEVIIDQLHFDRRGERLRWTVGRQNIIWDDGFLLLEGKPYDGSRSIFHDALRLRFDRADQKWDAAVIYNTKRDPMVLAGDNNLNLRDADELGVALRVEAGHSTAAYLFKREDDPDGHLPDLTTHTLSVRSTRGSRDGLFWMYELAGQYLWRDAIFSDRSGFAFALQTRLDFNLGSRTRGTAGFFNYDDAFRTPWGRWPLWSELYIYTLIGEGGDGRVHVAAWENIAAPYLGAERPLGQNLKARVRGYYLLAPAQDWQARGLLLQTRLDFTINRHASGHLLWEMLDPGSFHQERTPAMTETAHFLRWEIILKL